MNKPARPFAKPLRDIAGKVVGQTFARQGFASAELVIRWTEIVGLEIAAHSEPIKIQWARRPGRGDETRARHAGAAGGRPGGNRDPASGRRHLRTRQPFLDGAPSRASRCGRRRCGAVVNIATACRLIPSRPGGSPHACRRSTTTICARRWRGWLRRSSKAELPRGNASFPQSFPQAIHIHSRMYSQDPTRCAPASLLTINHHLISNL